MIEVLGKITYVDKPLLVKNINEVLAMVPHGTR
jgi:flagellar biosynthesis/type III secretory pathway protein FliH